MYLLRVLRLTQCNFRALARTDRTSTGKIKELLIQYTTRVSSVPQATPLRRQMQLLQPTSLQKTNCLSFHSNRLFRASIRFITLPTPAKAETWQQRCSIQCHSRCTNCRSGLTNKWIQMCQQNALGLKNQPGFLRKAHSMLSRITPTNLLPLFNSVRSQPRLMPVHSTLCCIAAGLSPTLLLAAPNPIMPYLSQATITATTMEACLFIASRTPSVQPGVKKGTR